MHLLKLPSHTIHLLQLLDLGVFNHLKCTWEPIVGQFTQQQVRLIKKADFLKFLAKMWLSFIPEWAVAGFKLAGVVPFNNKAVPESFMRPSEVFSGSDSLERDEDDDSDDDPFADCITDLLDVDSSENSLLTGPSADEVIIQPDYSSPQSPSVVSSSVPVVLPCVPVMAFSAPVLSSSAPVVSPSTPVVSLSALVISPSALVVSLSVPVVSPSVPVVSPSVPVVSFSVPLYQLCLPLCQLCLSPCKSCLPLCLQLYLTLLILAFVCY